jgi:hypothetical protein
MKDRQNSTNAYQAISGQKMEKPPGFAGEIG